MDMLLKPTKGGKSGRKKGGKILFSGIAVLLNALWFKNCYERAEA